MARGGENERRASIFEIVGAWLHIWVPPRDVEIPPVPWRKLGIGAAAGALVIAAALAVMIPRIQEGKDQRAALLRAQQEKSLRANRERITRVQRPQHGQDPGLRPPADASAAERQAARERLLERVQSDILADARARSATGEIRRSVAGPTTCEPTPGTPTGRKIGVFDCFTVSRRIRATQRTAAGAAGFPFRAVVDFGDFSYTWCKVEQVPGEMMIMMPDRVVNLPPACLPPKDM